MTNDFVDPSHSKLASLSLEWESQSNGNSYFVALGYKFALYSDPDAWSAKLLAYEPTVSSTFIDNGKVRPDYEFSSYLFLRQQSSVVRWREMICAGAAKLAPEDQAELDAYNKERSKLQETAEENLQQELELQRHRAEAIGKEAARLADVERQHAADDEVGKSVA
jgi:hypothetical protein